MAPLSKVMSVTSSGGDYFGHRRYKSVEPQGPTELHKGVSTAGCSRGMRARNHRGQTRAGARAESQHGVHVAPATEGWAVQRVANGTTVLLPVTLPDVSAGETDPSASALHSVEPHRDSAPAASGIEIELDGARVRVTGTVDPVQLRLVLRCLMPA